MKRMRIAAVLVAGLAVTGVGCSSSSYSKADFQKDLEEEADLSPEVSKCVADGADEAGLDFAKMNDADTVEEAFPGDDQEKFTEVITKCMLDDAGLDPDMSIPDASDLTVPEN